MFRRILAIFFILSNLNASMLLPEGDGFLYADNCNGNTDNINSLAEYINEIVLDNPDHSSDDQNADQDFHYAKQTVYHCQVPETRITWAAPDAGSRDFGEQIIPKIIPLHYEVIIPPPKA